VTDIAPDLGMPEDSAPRQRRPSRSSSLLGTVGCLLVLALLVLGVAGMAFGSMIVERFFESPRDAVSRFLGHVNEGDYRDAYGMLCEPLRGEWSEGRLRQEMEAQRAGLGGIQRHEIDEIPFPRGERGLGLYYRIRGTLRSRQVQAFVVREDGWRLCGFEWPRGG
jgi:hypothetical protein